MAGVPASSRGSSSVTGGALSLLASVIAAGGETTLDTGANGVAQTANHLMVVILSRHNTGELVNSGGLRFNNDSGANYGTERLRANNVTATPLGSAGGSTCGQIISAGTTAAGAFAQTTVWIAGYTLTMQKTALCSIGMIPQTGTVGSMEGGVTTGGWSGTAAISRIAYVPPASLIAGSAMYVYGLV